MMVDILRYVAAALMLAGAIFALLAAIGVLRLPDLYMRLHAASKAGVVGAGLILAAVAISAFDAAVALRAVLGIVFLILSTPVSAHLLARAAYKVGLKPDSRTNIDEFE